MASTTVRVDLETYAQLKRLSEERGESMVDTIRAAARALADVEFARRVAAQYEELRRDPVAWAEYTADLDDAIDDGIEG